MEHQRSTAGNGRPRAFKGCETEENFANGRLNLMSLWNGSLPLGESILFYSSAVSAIEDKAWLRSLTRYLHHFVSQPESLLEREVCP